MKIIALYLLKYDPVNPSFLYQSYELSFVSWFQRPFFKETINFGARTTTARTPKGIKEAVEVQDAQAVFYIQTDNNNLTSIVVADKEYPDKCAFMIINKMQTCFYENKTGMFLDQVTKDTLIDIPQLNNFIVQYQDPKEVDKLMKIQQTLNEVNQIVHKSLDDILQRGETLESLMAKSKDMSAVSLDFYKKAKQTNKKCCSLY